MTTVRLAALYLFLTACANSNAGRNECNVSAPTAAALASVAHGTALAANVRAALMALASGDPSNPALREAGLEDPHTSGQQPITHPLQCLAIVRWTDEGPFVAFYLAPVKADGSVGAEEFIMLATHHGDRWRFTWPANLGAPLH